MAGNKFIKSFLSVVLSGILIATPVFQWSAGAQTSIAQNKSKQSQLEKKNAELKKKLEETKNNINKEEEYQQTLSSKIGVVKQQIDAINQQILSLDKEISKMQSQIEDTQVKIDKNIEILKQRLRAIYIAGETSTIDIILGAKDFSDFLDKADIIKTISKHDSDLIDELNADMESIKKQKEEIEKNRSEVAEERKSLESKRNELDELLDENEKVIKSLEKEKKTALDKMDENDAELKSIEREIQEYYRKQEEERKKQEQQQGGSGSGTIVPSPGGYAWPVPGFTYLSSQWNEDRGSYNHGAIDIAGRGIYGAPVVAAASGTVIKGSSGGWGGGYGTYLMIDHGNGKSTLYAHMSGLAVSIGSKVSKGQVIGYVGSTGQSTGPHLHFETRLYGVKYNPMTEY